VKSTDWLGFNGYFTTVTLYRAIIKVQFGLKMRKQKILSFWECNIVKKWSIKEEDKQSMENKYTPQHITINPRYS